MCSVLYRDSCTKNFQNNKKEIKLISLTGPKLKMSILSCVYAFGARLKAVRGPAQLLNWNERALHTTMFFSKNFFFLAIFVKKWLSPRKNFQREIFFEINFFGLKYVLKHSESIPKKNFFRKFFRKFSLFGYFRQKMVKSQKKISNGNFFSISTFSV